MPAGNIDLRSAGVKPFALRLLNKYWPVDEKGPGLDADDLIRSARRSTGFSDLGEDFDPVALQTLVRSINTEARLSRFGVFVMRSRLIGSLKTRLRAIQHFKNEPWILEIPVAPIWLITGLQRTGTTFLQRLLSADPEARALLSWESLDPVPHGERSETRIRIRNARRSEKALKWIAPAFFAIHPIKYAQPEEDVLLLDSSFFSTAPEAIMHVPSYAAWLEQRGCRQGYEWEKKMLQLLQWQRPATRWVLKSPHHLEFLDEFMEVFPATSVIWTHRDPEHCVPSFLSMIWHGRSVFSDDVRIVEVRDHWFRKMQRMARMGMSYRAENPGFTPIDVYYEEFINDAESILRNIYHSLGSEFSAHFQTIIQNRLTQRELSDYVKHAYRPEDFHLSSEAIKNSFRAYSLELNNKDIDGRQERTVQ